MRSRCRDSSYEPARKIAFKNMKIVELEVVFLANVRNGICLARDDPKETASEFPISSPHNVRWHLGCKTASSVQDRGLRKAEVFTMQMQSIVLSLATVVGHRYSIIHYRYH